MLVSLTEVCQRYAPHLTVRLSEDYFSVMSGVVDGLRPPNFGEGGRQLTGHRPGHLVFSLGCPLTNWPSGVSSSGNSDADPKLQRCLQNPIGVVQPLVLSATRKPGATRLILPVKLFI